MMAIKCVWWHRLEAWFGVLALLWLTTAWRAYAAIRAGQIQQHQQWMIRTIPHSPVPITLRIYLPLNMVAGIFDLVILQLLGYAGFNLALRAIQSPANYEV